MAKRHSKAHAHLKAAHATAQKNHEELLGHLKNIESALNQDQAQDAPTQPGGPGQTMGDGSSPLGGKAIMGS